MPKLESPLSGARGLLQSERTENKGTITYFIVLYERRSKHLSIVRPMSFCDPTQQGMARCLDPSGRGRLCLFHGDYAVVGQVISAVTDEEIC